ncbi:hypothetical protein [Streptomyces sp. NBC_01760]|uniref:hypothetical protein n=1 Tax=Streptomyces sp. NBC_01760 TaxID=2975931 RepID=UPI002DDB8A1E|nr:hypothetical protein [Streptomyces sp. NBC_01760]WSC72110.1 hypothetical protein OG807_28585 [Streptomyces sp. NBC_01760]
MEWLHGLWAEAGEPSSHELGQALGCSHTTVVRLFKGYPARLRRAYDLIEHLYGNPLGRVVRSEADWDALHAKAKELLAAADPARRSGVAPTQMGGRMSRRGDALSVSPRQEFQLSPMRESMVAAAATVTLGKPLAWVYSEELAELHKIAAAGREVQYSVIGLPEDALAPVRLPPSHDPLEVFFGYFSGFQVCAGERGGLSIGKEGSSLSHISDLIPPCRSAVVLLDNVHPSAAPSVDLLAVRRLHDPDDGLREVVLILAGQQGLPVVRRLALTCAKLRTEGQWLPSDGFKLFARAGIEAMKDAPDDFTTMHMTHWMG